jgi:hypothetical protein
MRQPLLVDTQIARTVALERVLSILVGPSCRPDRLACASPSCMGGSQVGNKTEQHREVKLRVCQNLAGTIPTPSVGKPDAYREPRGEQFDRIFRLTTLAPSGYRSQPSKENDPVDRSGPLTRLPGLLRAFFVGRSMGSIFEVGFASAAERATCFSPTRPETSVLPTKQITIVFDESIGSAEHPGN